MQMSKDELIEAARKLTGGDIKDLTLDELRKLVTVTQFITDSCILEFEERSELTMHLGSPVIPYHSDYYVKNILTDPDRR